MSWFWKNSADKVKRPPPHTSANTPVDNTIASATSLKPSKSGFWFEKTKEYGLVNHPTCMAFDPAQQLLAVGTNDGTIQMLGQHGINKQWQAGDNQKIQQLIFVINEGLLIASCPPKSLYMWNFATESHEPEMAHVLTLKTEEITTCYLPYGSAMIYVGTKKGCVYFFRSDNFARSKKDCMWNKLAKGHTQTHPGAVTVMIEEPTDATKMLVGFEKGLVVHWDLKEEIQIRVFRTFDLAPMTSLAFSSEEDFVMGHDDGKLTTWTLKESAKTSAGDTNFDFCEPTLALSCCKLVNKHEAVIYDGGPTPLDAAVHYVNIAVKGKRHPIRIAFESRVLTHICLADDPWGTWEAPPHTLAVLLSDHIEFFDLKNEGDDFPRLHGPHGLDSQISPTSCTQLVQKCPQNTILALRRAGRLNSNCVRHWPLRASGGGEFATWAIGHDLIICGHVDGRVRFWDVSAGTHTAELIYCLAPPPPCKSLADKIVHHIQFCEQSLELCVVHEGGTLLHYVYSDIAADVEPQSIITELRIADTPTAPATPNKDPEKETPKRKKRDLAYMNQALKMGFSQEDFIEAMEQSGGSAVAALSLLSEKSIDDVGSHTTPATQSGGGDVDGSDGVDVDTDVDVVVGGGDDDDEDVASTNTIRSGDTDASTDADNTSDDKDEDQQQDAADDDDSVASSTDARDTTESGSDNAPTPTPTTTTTKDKDKGKDQGKDKCKDQGKDQGKDKGGGTPKNTGPTRRPTLMLEDSQHTDSSNTDTAAHMAETAEDDEEESEYLVVGESTNLKYAANPGFILQLCCSCVAVNSSERVPITHVSAMTFVSGWDSIAFGNKHGACVLNTMIMSAKCFSLSQLESMKRNKFMSTIVEDDSLEPSEDGLTSISLGPSICKDGEEAQPSVWVGTNHGHVYSFVIDDSYENDSERFNAAEPVVLKNRFPIRTFNFTLDTGVSVWKPPTRSFSYQSNETTATEGILEVGANRYQARRWLCVLLPRSDLCVDVHYESKERDTFETKVYGRYLMVQRTDDPSGGWAMKLKVKWWYPNETYRTLVKNFRQAKTRAALRAAATPLKELIEKKSISEKEADNLRTIWKDCSIALPEEVVEAKPHSDIKNAHTPVTHSKAKAPPSTTTPTTPMKTTTTTLIPTKPTPTPPTTKSSTTPTKSSSSTTATATTTPPPRTPSTTPSSSSTPSTTPSTMKTETQADSLHNSIANAEENDHSSEEFSKQFGAWVSTTKKTYHFECTSTSPAKLKSKSSELNKTHVAWATMVDGVAMILCLLENGILHFLKLEDLKSCEKLQVMENNPKLMSLRSFSVGASGGVVINTRNKGTEMFQGHFLSSGDKVSKPQGTKKPSTQIFRKGVEVKKKPESVKTKLVSFFKVSKDEKDLVAARNDLLGKKIDDRQDTYVSVTKTGTAGVNPEMERLKIRLDERTQKLSEMGDTSEALANHAQDFGAATSKLADYYKNKKWYEF